jgi:hypothetical protein
MCLKEKEGFVLLFQSTLVTLVVAGERNPTSFCENENIITELGGQ